MRKARNKKLSLLMALVFAFTVIFPAGAAFAADADFSQAYEYVSTGDDVDAGSITVEQDDSSTAAAVYVEVTLPEGVEFDTTPKSSTNLTAELENATFASAKSNWMRVEATAWGTQATTIKFEDDLSLNIDDDFTGNLNVDVDVIGVNASGRMTWSESDTLTIAKVSESKVTVTVGTLKKVGIGGNKNAAKITLEESKAGDFADGERVTFEIDTEGVTFNKNNIDITPYGVSLDASYLSADEQVDTDADYVGDYLTGTGNTIAFDENDENKITVQLNENTSAFPGELVFEYTLDIDPDVTGDIDITVTSDDSDGADLDETVTVATIGDVAAEIKDLEDNDNTIYAGQQKELDVEFTLATTDGSDFKDGDIITFELSQGKFVSVDENGLGDAKLYDDDKAFYYTCGDGSGTDDDDEIDFSKLEIKLNNDAEAGDVTITVSGDYGDLEEFVIATAAKPYTVTADKPNILGEALGQAAGDITITETNGGAMKPAELVYVELPSGVELSGKPKIEVTEGNGDADIDDYGDDYFVIEVSKKSASSKPTTFRVYNLKYDTGKLALTGDVELKFYGDDPANRDAGDDEYEFKDDSLMTTVANATVADPNAVTASFKVGDEGVTILNGRTMVQVNQLCDVLGLQKSWDEASKTAYFVKEGKVVAFPMGENAIYINGIKITVDQGGKIINNYTYATLRGIQMAFGGELTWDDTTKTATFNFSK